jgi:hypothetical protein
LPIQIYLDGNATPLGEQAMRDALTTWNDLLGPHYAHADRVFDVVGEHHDTFDRNDYEDGRRSIYLIYEPVPDEQYLQDVYREKFRLAGYCPLGDCFIVMYYIEEWLVDWEDDISVALERGVINENQAAEIQRQVDEYRYNWIFNVTLHELGHMLGLQHYDQRFGIMNTDGAPYWQLDRVTDADLDAFCLIYECRDVSIELHD